MTKPLTAVQKKQELAKCRHPETGFLYFFENYVHIQLKSGEIVKPKANRAQRRYIALLMRLHARGVPVRVMILKARQMGFSTICQAFLAWRAFIFFGQSCVTLAHLEEPSAELFGKVERIYDNLPEWLRPVRLKTRTGKRLALGGKHQALLYVDHAGNQGAGRSQTFQNGHLSEVAFWRFAKVVMTALMQTFPRLPNTTVQVESTANGMGDWFHQTWVAAELGEGHRRWNGWHAFFSPWFEDEEYERPATPIDAPLDKDERKYQRKYKLTIEQMLWRRDKIGEIGEDDFKQEYPATSREAFLASGRPFFPTKILAPHEEKLRDPIRVGDFQVPHGSERAKFIDDESGNLHLFELPDPTKRYVVSGDIASGGDRDFTFVHVLKLVAPYEVVATYRGKCDPDEAALLMERLGKVYCPKEWATLAPERNGPGLQTVGTLWKRLYPRIFRRRDETKVGAIESKDLGWLTSPSGRQQQLERLKEAIREGDIVIPCKRTFDELQSFVYDGEDDKPQAPKGGWDDGVMSLSIGVNVADRQPLHYGRDETTDNPDDDGYGLATGY